MKYLILILFLFTSCVSTEIYNPESKPQIEYKKKPHKDFDSTDINIKVDSTLNEDTMRYQIDFNPTVEDWEEN